jgi:DNA-binding ferritin-like protein
MKNLENIAELVSLLICARDASEQLHIKIGSGFNHTALQEFYEEVTDEKDEIQEMIIGIMNGDTTIVSLITPFNFTKYTEKDSFINLLNTIYEKIGELKINCGYHEISAELDEILALISTTKYKLMSLK